MTIHVVKEGDTIWTIANQYNVSAQRIISDNGLIRPQNLVIGQALIILFPKIIYTIKPGDTLFSIASQFGTSVINLVQNNPFLTESPYLTAGQTIVISFEGEKRRPITLNAYVYPYVQQNVLVRALPYLTYLTIFGYGFTTDGDLIPIDDQPLINLAYRFQTAPVMLLSSISEDGTFSGTKASLLFHDTQLQNTVLRNIIYVMQEKGYVGLDIDFEYVNAEDAEAYLGFLKNATEQMHANGFFVNTDLAPKTSAAQAGLLYESHNYRAVGEISDTVLLMTYEWGYTYGPPMAVAPINKVREVISYGVTEIPPYKILMGLPNYGYDWALPFVKGQTRATAIGNQYAVEIASNYRVPIQFDELAQSPFFEYIANNGISHVVWFEDVRSMLAKFNLLEEYQLLGGGYWNAMRPFEQNWALVNSLYDIRKVV